eukprot:5281018-Alexandrium_andersonii.AAC.1
MLGLEKRRALAQESGVGAPVCVEVGALAADPGGGDSPDLKEIEAFALLKRTFQSKGKGKGGEGGSLDSSG